MRTLERNALLVSLSLALAIAGCGRAVAPVSTDRGAAHATGAAIEPSPGEPAPPEADGTPRPTPAPSASISDPRPSHLFAPILPPTVTIHWSPDVPAPAGPTPTHYRYKVFDQNGTEFDFTQLLATPVSMLRFYAPAFEGWTDVDASVTQATLHDLDPSAAHVFVLIAMGDHGRFDNALSFDKNMLYFHVSPALVVDRNHDGTR
jgi:hypothetical protein